MTNIDHYVQQAANEYTSKFVFPYGPESVRCTVEAFAAGAAWQKEHADPSPDTVRAAGLVNNAAIDRHNEIRDALGTLGEGIAEMLKRQGELAASAVRGAERGQRAIDAIKDVGEKVEACMAIANNTEEGLAAAIEKLDKLGVEKWREAIKHVEAEGTTEPMHAEVKAAGVSRDPMASWDAGKAYARAATECYSKKEDASGLGKLWADVPTKLEEVSDETLRELAVSGQISEARYFEEFTRRHGIKRDRPTARDVIAMMEKAMLAADEAGVKLDWRVTVGAI